MRYEIEETGRGHATEREAVHAAEPEPVPKESGPEKGRAAVLGKDVQEAEIAAALKEIVHAAEQDMVA